MSMIVIWFKKILLVVGVAAMGLASVPLANTYALGPSQAGTPPPSGQPSTDRLQQAWSKEQAAYGKLGKLLNDAAGRISKLQDFINQAKAKGKDIFGLQSALDAFSAALKQVQPAYQSAQSTVSSHPGFDASGRVTDATAALQAVKSLGDNLRQIQQTLFPAAKALRDAFTAFRQVNKPTSTPVPGQSGG